VSAELLLQYAVVGLAVTASAGHVARHRFPGTVRAARVALAVGLLRRSQSPLARSLAQRLAPPSPGAGACRSCNGCSGDRPLGAAR